MTLTAAPPAAPLLGEVLPLRPWAQLAGPSRDPGGRACAVLRATHAQLQHDLEQTPSYVAWRAQPACARADRDRGAVWDALDCTDSLASCKMTLTPLFVHLYELGTRLRLECGSSALAASLQDGARLGDEDEGCARWRTQLRLAASQRDQALEVLAWQAHPSCQAAEAGLRQLAALRCGAPQAADKLVCQELRQSYELDNHECQLQPEQCDVYSAPIYIRILELREALRQRRCGKTSR